MSAQRLPRRRFVSPDGWVLIAMVWAGVAIGILGFKIVDMMQ